MNDNKSSDFTMHQPKVRETCTRLFPPRALDSIHAQINNFTIHFYFIRPWMSLIYSPPRLPRGQTLQDAIYTIFTPLFSCSNFGHVCPFWWISFGGLFTISPSPFRSPFLASQIIDHHSPRQSIQFSSFSSSAPLFRRVCCKDISLIAFYRHMVCAVPLNGMKTRKSSSLLLVPPLCSSALNERKQKSFIHKKPWQPSATSKFIGGFTRGATFEWTSIP